jgi:hypothetical protein
MDNVIDASKAFKKDNIIDARGRFANNGSNSMVKDGTTGQPITNSYGNYNNYGNNNYNRYSNPNNTGLGSSTGGSSYGGSSRGYGGGKQQTPQNTKTPKQPTKSQQPQDSNVVNMFNNVFIGNVFIAFPRSFFIDNHFRFNIILQLVKIITIF